MACKDEPSEDQCDDKRLEVAPQTPIKKNFKHNMNENVMDDSGNLEDGPAVRTNVETGEQEQDLNAAAAAAAAADNPGEGSTKDLGNSDQETEPQRATAKAKAPTPRLDPIPPLSTPSEG